MATPKLRLVTTRAKLATARDETLLLGINLPEGKHVTTGSRIIMRSEADDLFLVGQIN